METGCVLIDRQEHRWGLKVEEQVAGAGAGGVCPRLLHGPQTRVSTQRKGLWTWRDCTKLKVGLGLAGPELKHLFWEASRATSRSGLYTGKPALSGQCFKRARRSQREAG